jgi:hypothetical protein
VERANLIIRQATVKFMAENSTKQFAAALLSLIYSYNTKKQRSSKFTPFQIHRRRHEQFPIDVLVQANLKKNAEMMVKASLKKNIKKEAAELEISDTVCILNNALIQIKKYGSLKVRSLKKNAKIFNYTKKVYTVIEKKNFNGLWKYKLDGYTDRWFPSPFLIKVDIHGMTPLGTEKHKNTISFNTTYDRYAQLQSLHEGNRKQAELTPE